MNKLVVTTLESRFRLYDMRTHHPVHGYAFLSQARARELARFVQSKTESQACVWQAAHESTVWAAYHLPQNRDIFMTTGGNGSLELWKYSYPTQRKIKEKDGHEKGGIVHVEQPRKVVWPAAQC